MGLLIALMLLEAQGGLALSEQQACGAIRASARSQTGQSIGPATVVRSDADCRTKTILIEYRIATVSDQSTYSAAFFQGVRDNCRQPAIAAVLSYGYHFRYVVNFEDGQVIEQIEDCKTRQ